MKYLLPLMLLAACATEPKAPVVCQQNLQYCTSVFNPQQGLSLTEWNKACMKDYSLCKSEWGQR